MNKVNLDVEIKPSKTEPWVKATVKSYQLGGSHEIVQVSDPSTVPPEINALRDGYVANFNRLMDQATSYPARALR